MGGLFWNKIFAAVLATALVVFGINELSHKFINSEQPETPGFAVVIESASDDTVTEIVKEVSLAELLSGASASSGERVAKKCTACHTFEKDGVNKIGPALWNVVGRDAAAVDGFKYSSALSASGLNWDFENLNAFLKKPKELVPGTSMSFIGLKKATDRANFMLWLREKSDAPISLPAFAAPVVEAASDVMQDVADEASSLIEAASDGVADVVETASELAEKVTATDE
ncbi:MAG: cytochrome c family protein [Robiginitomaculum sp.]|nr:cytochrome c family protein [Robiginitomaculum sp.]